MSGERILARIRGNRERACTTYLDDMLTFLLAAQIVVADSIYPSASMRALVEDASRLNRQVPASLGGYRARAESEIAIVARRPEGNEGAVSVEQTQNEVKWARTGEYEQRVVGYRAQSIGLQLSSLSFFRQAWTVPVLYGNRLTLLFGRDTSSRRPRRVRQEQRLVAVHPLAEDRERVYRYSGGDTLATLRVNGRAIPIVRLLVEPRDDAHDSTVAFRGELDLDVSRHVLVRMRGYFVRKASAPSFLTRLASFGGFTAVAFVELENGEIDGRYWLPLYQRIEAQVAMTGATDSRSIFRIVTHFRAHEVQPADTARSDGRDSLTAHPFDLRLAPAESLSTKSGWYDELGVATSTVHSDDFDDIAPDVWRASGEPLFQWRTQRLMDLVHVNRIEGLYTGFGAELRMRDAAPGMSVRANAGWAWSESTARGRASAEWVRGANRFVARAGRSLDLTNDFRSVFDSGSSVAAIFGYDNYDYVDRRMAALGWWRRIGRGRSAILRVESGPVIDGMVQRTLSRGLFRSDSGFRENRGVREGSYWRSWASLEWHPDVSAEFVHTGVGALVSAEFARGELDYTRIEGRVVARKNRGRFTLAARGDAGTVLGDAPPPQQLFELGSNQYLAGYGYKEFAGTDAVALRGLAMYRLGVFDTPVRIRRWFVPGVAPALALGLQSGWTQAVGAGGRASLRELGLVAPGDAGDPRPAAAAVSRVTGGVRTTVTVGLRIFGGGIGVGMARAVDRPAPWRLVVDFTQGM
jgi:hypothetical protein